MTSIITLRKKWQYPQFFTPKMQFLSYLNVLWLYAYANLYLILDPDSDHVIQVRRGPVWYISGFATSGLGATVFPGGESEALKRLDRYLERKVH